MFLQQNQEAANEMLSANGSWLWPWRELPAESKRVRAGPYPLLVQPLQRVSGPDHATAGSSESAWNPRNRNAPCLRCSAESRVK